MILLEAMSDHQTGGPGSAVFREAKSMVIDFGGDVGQCVACTDSSSVKSEATTQRIQGRVDSCEFCVEECEEKYNPQTMGPKVWNAEILQEHLKKLQRVMTRRTLSTGIMCSGVTA